MSVSWEFLSGDTSRFALKVSLALDPFEGEGVTADESASWGGFEFWVNGVNLCAHTDSGERVEGVYWYLLPLLEWLVEHWDPLLHEERLPVEVAGVTAVRSLRQTAYAAVDNPETGASAWQPWWERHSLMAARAGGIFPEVMLRRWRDQVEISWDSMVIPGAPRDLAFTATLGSARFAPAEVAEPLATVLQAAVAELDRRCPASQRVTRLHQGVLELSSDSRWAVRMAWLAGLGSSFTEMRDRWTTVLDRSPRLATRLRSALADGLCVQGTPRAGLLFGAVSPTISMADVDVLTAFLLDQYRQDAQERADDPVWMEIARALDAREAPWRQGYELAEAVYAEMDVDLEQTIDLDRLFADLGILVSTVDLEDLEIRGLAAAGPEHRPAIALNRRYPFHGSQGAERFTMAHELCHVLFDRTAAHEVAEASGPWAPLEVEQRANAFAAMLLMPEDVLRSEFRSLRAPVTAAPQLEPLATRLGVSIRALAWHAQNLGLVTRALALGAAAEF